MNKKKILLIFGTRPEAIKMAPLYFELKANEEYFEVELCVTAQHRELLDQVLKIFKIKPRWDLNLMVKDQRISNLVARMIADFSDVFDEYDPDMVLVHGDTATTFAASVFCFFNGIKISHIEAGLRTNDKRSPFPEEYNRRCASLSADWHFAPTIVNKNNLIDEGVSENTIFITGNTVIDSLFMTLSNIQNNPKKTQIISNSINSLLNFDCNRDPFILITGHRRENFGDGFKNICQAILNLSESYNNMHFVYPAHFNPNVQKPVYKILGNKKNIHIINPLDYEVFIYLLNKCYLVLTDSGGIQEEAPSLGKPVVVMRSNTERPEALESGTVVLAGTDKDNIYQSVSNILSNKKIYKKMSMAHNPYGDGNACEKIVDHLKQIL